MKEAIELALKNNLGVLVAETQVGESAGARERALSALSPHVAGDASASLQNRNLQTAGISVPGLPVVVGPFSVYDFRLFASQSVLDKQAYHTWKASVFEEHSARLSYQDARDVVIRSAAGLYLNSEFNAAEVQTAQSRVETSETLEKLARDQRAQGLATGIDVIRAQVRLTRDRQSLLLAQNAFAASMLDLSRFLGVAPGTPFELSEQLQFLPMTVPNLDKALPEALAARADYRALAAQIKSIAEQQKASRARYSPKFAVSGDYGRMGRSFGTMPGIGEIQGTVAVTFFDRDARGEQLELENRMRRANAQMNDLARGIEQDLRKAELDLASASEQVKVTQAALDLAARELTLARDRFRSGVGDNIEVITAQDALARAQDDNLGSLARHADARMAMVRALGGGENNYRAYLGLP